MKTSSFFRNLMLLSIAAILPFLSAACDRLGQREGNEEFTPIVLTKSQQAVAASGDAFALDFLKASTKAFPDKNLFLSPMSVSMLSCMLACGAQGETYAEIVKALGMDGFTIDQVNDCYTTLVASLLKADKSVSLSLANSIWAADGLDVRASFKKQMTSVYQADTYTVDFSANSTLKTINDWCSNKTSGLIPRMFEEIDPQVQMILINALYFKGNWKVQFPKDQTAQGTFTTLSGQNATADYMQATSESFKGYLDDEVTVVRMPYGNGAFEMEAIMPVAKDFYAFLNGLTLEKLARWDVTTTQKVALTFPKFKAEFDTEKQLVPIMMQLGVRCAFDGGRADFGKMSSTGLYVSDMRQKSFVSVDEEGTEAAAVTVAEMRKNAAPDGTVSMNFNRPFLYLIREKSTGVILFAGLKVK